MSAVTLWILVQIPHALPGSHIKDHYGDDNVSQSLTLVPSGTMFFSYFAVILGSLSASVAGTDIETRASDPCAAIAQTWAAPSAVRACYTSFAVNETIKSNVRFALLRPS